MSIGNIMSYDGHAKLSDLEYAKKTSDLTSHEKRMASESSITLYGKSLITYHNRVPGTSCRLK